VVGGGDWGKLLANNDGHDDDDAARVVSLIGGFVEVPPPRMTLLLRLSESPCSWFEWCDVVFLPGGVA
jgi:hypothetical protein